MIIPYHDKSRKRKKKNLTKKLSIFNAYINFKLSKVSNSREEIDTLIKDNDFEKTHTKLFADLQKWMNND